MPEAIIQNIIDFVERDKLEVALTLPTWVDLNTHSFNYQGIAEYADILACAYQELADSIQWIECPPFSAFNSQGEWTERALGPLLHIQARPEAPTQVLLCGHMDTVYPPTHPFQRLIQHDGELWQGPGVADMKGGLLVMLEALRCVETLNLCPDLGWQVILNPDEEIGSPGSRELISRVAAEVDAALVFEPTKTPEGALVSARKGSGKYQWLVRGKAAHAGRNFSEGRNAIVAASRLVQAFSALNNQQPGVTVNLGLIQGGSASNVVPDRCWVEMDVRMENVQEQKWIEKAIKKILAETRHWEGMSVEMHGGITRPPKKIDPSQGQFMQVVNEAAETLAIPMSWENSGGVCDGNNIAALGVPVVDTLGVRGGHVHSPDEYLLVSSIAERSALTALILRRIAEGALRS